MSWAGNGVLSCVHPPILLGNGVGAAAGGFLSGAFARSRKIVEESPPLLLGVCHRRYFSKLSPSLASSEMSRIWKKTTKKPSSLLSYGQSIDPWRKKLSIGGGGGAAFERSVVQMARFKYPSLDDGAMHSTWLHDKDGDGKTKRGGANIWEISARVDNHGDDEEDVVDGGKDARHTTFDENEGILRKQRSEHFDEDEGGLPRVSLNSCVYIKGDMAAGQSEEHSATVVIYGNVARGASVAASGDVIVLGKLMGEAIAGKDGDSTAEIFALEMQPTLLKIAQVAQPGPVDPGIRAPEIARLSTADNLIRIFPAKKKKSSKRDDGDVVDRGVDECSNTGENGEGANKLPGAGEGEGMMDGLRWTKAAKAALWTGCYIYVVGLLVVIFPKKVFGLLFNPAAISEGWIRVFGILAVVFGVYYAGAAIGDAAGAGARGFYVSTVIGRQVLFWSFCVLVVFKAVEPGLLLLAVINLLGALWMKRSLANQN